MHKISKTEANKERLLKEGVELFSEHGYHGIGLNGILSTVKIPKGSFYHYFKSKEDYVAEVIDYYTEINGDYIKSNLDTHTASGFKAIEIFFASSIKSHLKEGNKRGCLAGNLGAEISDTSELCRSAVERSMEMTRNAFAIAIKKGQTDGSIRQDTDSTMLADILLNTFEGALLRMKVCKTKESLTQFQNHTLKTLLTNSACK